MSDLKADDGKQAIRCLEHLLYTVPASALHNVAATLAQEFGQSVSIFGSAAGYWTFEVVERFLLDRGMKCTRACLDGSWQLDSLQFLQSHPGLVGLIDCHCLHSYVLRGASWSGEDGEDMPRIDNSVVVHRMWTPLLPFYNSNRAFHITVDNAQWERHECQPSSCWRVEPVSYEGRETAVKAQMRIHKKSAILMSNSNEIVLCRPAKRGWETSTLLNYECMPTVDLARNVAETLANRIVGHIEQNQNQGWSVMAHALFSALQHLNGRVQPGDFSTLTPQEQDVLRLYEQGLETLSSK
tara:strand:+ start:5274 stop:6164 length:891 start_codon:yes stop_codon:yes gene_type:complete